MKEFIRKRRLIPLGIWFVIYMALFFYLEVRPPEDVHIIRCALDDMIPHVPAFVFPYLSWFPYIAACAYLAMRNLREEEYVWSLLLLGGGMTLFLIGCFVWPSGLDLREGIAYDMGTVSGRLLHFVQTVDAPKSVFPSMHVYVTLVLQYTLELQRRRLPLWGLMLGRVTAALIIVSTMFTKQHSALDAAGAIILFAALLAAVTYLRKEWTISSI